MRATNIVSCCFARPRRLRLSSATSACVAIRARAMQNPHSVREVQQEVKHDHVIIAYVLFVLSFLQLVRLFAGWCVNRGKRSHHARGNAQTWLYDDDGDKYRSIDNGKDFPAAEF